jgi:hypothetical protein
MAGIVHHNGKQSGAWLAGRAPGRSAVNSARPKPLMPPNLYGRKEVGILPFRVIGFPCYCLSMRRRMASPEIGKIFAAAETSVCSRSLLCTLSASDSYLTIKAPMAMFASW